MYTGVHNINERLLMSPEEKFSQLYEEMATLCEKQGWGDPFSYARSKEIYAANALGHDVAETFSGADAYRKGQACEYKSTTDKSCKGSYTGVSVQSTWEEQVRYLANEKIAPYEHYYNRFEKGRLVESWMVPGDVVHKILLPKFKKKYPTVLSKKDPRLSANMSWTEIQKYGIKVELERS
jgi:hypothetical protein